MKKYTYTIMKTPSFEEQLKQWEQFYKELFSISGNFQDLLPEIHAHKKRGFNRAIIIPQGLTVETLKDHLPFSCYDSFESRVYKNIDDRTTDKAYAILIRNRIEGDVQYKKLSLKQLLKKGIKGMTFLERLLLEMKYYSETKKNLHSPTLCYGTKHADGHMPLAWYWAEDFRVWSLNSLPKEYRFLPYPAKEENYVEDYTFTLYEVIYIPLKTTLSIIPPKSSTKDLSLTDRLLEKEEEKLMRGYDKKAIEKEAATIRLNEETRKENTWWIAKLKEPLRNLKRMCQESKEFEKMLFKKIGGIKVSLKFSSNDAYAEGEYCYTDNYYAGVCLTGDTAKNLWFEFYCQDSMDYNDYSGTSRRMKQLKEKSLQMFKELSTHEGALKFLKNI